MATVEGVLILRCNYGIKKICVKLLVLSCDCCGINSEFFLQLQVVEIYYILQICFFRSLLARTRRAFEILLTIGAVEKY